MKSLKHTILIILLTGLMCPIAGSALTVRVFDVNGTPIQGASVRVAYAEQDTNSEGIATIDIPQTYTIPISMVVTKEGYESYGAVLNAPYPTYLEVTLYSEETDFIRGTVYFDSKDTPAGPGYLVEVHDSRLNERIGVAVTDESSRFQYEISVDRTCFLVLPDFPEQRFEATPGDDLEIIVQTKARPKASILLQSGVKFTPTSVIIVGSAASQLDGVTALQVRSALLSWIGGTDPRVSGKVPGFKERYTATGSTILNQLNSVDILNDEANVEKSGFFTVLIGGPEINVTALRYNAMMSTKFKEDRSLPDKWFIQEPGGFSYKDSEYGIIALIPMYPQLDDSSIYTITGGDKRLCMLVVAGNAREGTYAAGLKLKEILSSGTEGQELLAELDKLLVWVFMGESQTIQPVTIVVKYMDENTASIVDILVG